MIGILAAKQSAYLKNNSIVIGDLSCPLETAKSDTPKLLTVEELKHGIVIVHYSQGTPNGSRCIYLHHRGSIIDTQKKKCLGDYLRKIAEYEGNPPECQSFPYQPTWIFDGKKLHIIDSAGGVDVTIKV
jgi:hypothetical protein